MRQAVGEMSHYGEADYLVVNDDFDTTLRELRTILDAGRLRLVPQSARLRELLTELLSAH
jgi:guanylate kinase